MIKIVNGVEEQMTAEEETAFLAHREELRVKNEAEDAVIAQQVIDKANGNQKLLDLGLSQAETTALTGYTPPAA